ncbi:MAG: flagellar biosynthetic protein FliR [Oscillospiraceae bacterium]|nr:flagellar biosynthetic protein FliR [Oscillospiraceae bacterium]
MTLGLDELLKNADYIILLLFRVGGLVVTSPIFGRVNIPRTAKICFTVSLTYLFLTVFPQTEPIVYTSLLGFLLICAGELVLGMALSYVTNIFFALTAFTAGQLIDMQIGFGIVNVYDIQNNMQAPVMGNVLNMLLLIVFFAIDGHHKLIEMVYLTIRALPIGTPVISPRLGLVALDVFKRAFLLGVMMALPLLASGLTLEIAFGLMMRAVPQIHMFVVGIPLKMFVGMLVFAATLPIYTNFTSRVFEEMYNGIERIFAVFTGG